MAEATKALSHTHTLLHMTIGQLVDHDTDKTANTQSEMSKIDYLSKSSLLSVGKMETRFLLHTFLQMAISWIFHVDPMVATQQDQRTLRAFPYRCQKMIRTTLIKLASSLLEHKKLCH